MPEFENVELKNNLALKMIGLEKKILDIEKKGARIRPLDLFSIAFFATMTSAIIVFGIILLLILKTKIFF